MEIEGAFDERQAAKLAGLKANTLRKYRQQGVGPAYVRISARCVRYLPSDILAWLNSRRVVPGSSAAREVVDHEPDVQ